MDAALWSKVRDIFEESLEAPEDSRGQFIEIACGGDAELRREVLRLIDLKVESAGFLETPPTVVLELKRGVDSGPVFRPGQLVANRFHIVRLIGYGGMGEVYEAEDRMLGGLKVALKTVRAPMLADERLRARFRAEAELSRKVTHPNVCRIYDVAAHSDGEYEEVLVLTMEYLPGETLSEHVDRSGPLEGEQAMAFAVQSLDALQAAHAAGVLHGDIKPNNVMLIRDGQQRLRVVLTDFGLARGLSGDSGTPLAASLHAGAPAYMAPEMADGSPASAASDLYAMGALLYEALTGERPFPGVKTFEAAKAKRHMEAPNPRRLAPGLNPRLEKLILHCLAPDPAQRCRSAAEAKAYLEPERPGRRTVVSLMLVLAALVLLAGWLVFSTSARERHGGSTVAVLPFENASGEADSDYIVHGLTDEIREALSRSPRLRVLARESSAEAGRARLSYAAAGTRLSADYVVGGSVRLSDGRLRVKVRLVQTSSGVEVWTHEFDKPGRDAIAARLEVSAAIATRLHASPAPQALAAMMQGSTREPEAYDLYLQARQVMNSRTTADLVRAYDLLGHALRLDPTYALAWTARAEARELLAGHDGHPFIDCMTEARSLALRALELDPDLPEALLEIAMIRQRFEWDWNAAADAFRMAVDRNPNAAEAHRLYAGFLSNLGRGAEAMEQIERARSLNPLSLRVRQLRAVILLRSRQYVRAAEEFETLLGANPEYRNLYAYAGDAFGQSGQWARALELHRESVRRFGPESQFLYNVAYALAMTGKPDEARAIALDLERRWPAENFLPTYLAKVWFGLGEADRAFYWLEKAWTERDASLMVLNVEPWYDPYRADPRFQDLVRRLGLTERPVSGNMSSK